MIEFLESIGPYAKTIAVAAGVLLALGALALVMYVSKTAFGPFVKVVCWMFSYTPGTKPNDIVAGISFGGRMLAWASLIALVVWFIFHR